MGQRALTGPEIHLDRGHAGMGQARASESARAVRLSLRASYWLTGRQRGKAGGQWRLEAKTRWNVQTVRYRYGVACVHAPGRGRVQDRVLVSVAEGSRQNSLGNEEDHSARRLSLSGTLYEWRGRASVQ